MWTARTMGSQRKRIKNIMNEEKDLPDIFYSKVDDSLEAFITSLIKDQNKNFSLSSLNAEYYKKK